MFLGFPIAKGAAGFVIGRIDSTWCIALHARGREDSTATLFAESENVGPHTLPPVVDFLRQALDAYEVGGPCADCGDAHLALTPADLKALSDFCASTLAKLAKATEAHYQGYRP